MISNVMMYRPYVILGIMVSVSALVMFAITTDTKTTPTITDSVDFDDTLKY